MKDLTAKTYNAVLNETYDFFKAQGISIIGEGYKEVATNPALLESYIESLVDGASANSQVVMSKLMENANHHILQESALAGIAPIASLSMPVIRKLWPKFALKEAIETEVAKTPRFVISYTRPYMWKGDGERYYLPRGLLSDASGAPLSGGLSGKNYITATVTVANGTVVSGDLNASSSGVALDKEGALVVSGASRTTRQPLDSDFRLVSVAATIGYDADGSGSGSSSDVEVVATLNRRLEINNVIIADVALKGTGVSASGQVIVRADLKAGTVSVAAVGFSAAGAAAGSTVTLSDLVVVLKAGVSEEYNEAGWSVGFDIGRRDVDIPSGQHLNAPLPIEALTDMMALYQIDGTKETVDLMTNVLANRLDLEVLEFLDNSFENQPGDAEFADYPGADSYSLSFDVRPAAGFAGSPKAWREELKPMIDHLAQRIKNQTYFQGGMFALVGNPLDIQLLTNVDWQFRGGQGVSMDGVDVDYSIGTYVGANAYRVIASVNAPQGDIYIVFTPSSNTQMTYKYYPYTFNVEMGYIDPNRSRVPSIMMTKRHTFQEFLPAIGRIHIVNNTGAGQFSAGYWPLESGSHWAGE